MAPLLWRKAGGDVFEYYEVEKNFKIFKIPCVDLTKFKIMEKFTHLLRVFTFSLAACLYVLIKYRGRFDKIIFFSHDNIPLYFLSFISRNIFYDIHDFPGKNFTYKRIMRKSFGFAVQTKWKAPALAEQFRVKADKIVYWPNGTDIDEFKLDISKIEARRVLHLPPDRTIVLYTGQLFLWKGADTLIKSIDFLSDKTLIYIVGGADSDVKRLKKNLKQAHDKRILFMPFQPHKMMPIWMRAADVLVLPNTGKQKISLYYTSPMKLFEYMAAGRPIVASAIPSIMEILNNDNSLLAEADNPRSFAEKIKFVADNPSAAEALSRQARLDAGGYTWDKRAEKILNFISQTTCSTF